MMADVNDHAIAFICVLCLIAAALIWIIASVF